MPSPKVTFAESALRDLEEIKRWYEKEGVPEIADSTLSKLLERIETLKQHPDIGRIVPEFNQTFLREIIHPPYRIVYRRNKKSIQIIRVWRSERIIRLPLEE